MACIILEWDGHSYVTMGDAAPDNQKVPSLGYITHQLFELCCKGNANHVLYENI